MKFKLPAVKKLFKSLGPGFITGASDDDPSGIATYSQTGAMFGYSQLWTSFFSFPLMAIVQEMCGRIGMVTGQGISGVIRKHYGKSLLYFAVTLLVIANTFNIGADLGAMAASAEMLLNVPSSLLLLIFTVLTLTLQVFLSYKTYARYLKFLTLALFSYIITAFIVNQQWTNVLKSTILPTISLTQPYLFNLIAILGTTISPYLFFWQADETVEEGIEHHKLKVMGVDVPKITRTDISNMRLDTVIGMLFSKLVMFFIILTTASTLAVNGITNITTAPQAAQALRPLAGDFAYLLFTVGIVGTGLLAIPILAGAASYAVSEAMGWNCGLNNKLNKAYGFYGVITAATVVGMIINFSGIDPIHALYYAAILNGIIAPPLIAVIIVISNNKRIMGSYTNRPLSNIVGWVTVLIMSVAVAALFATSLLS